MWSFCNPGGTDRQGLLIRIFLVNFLVRTRRSAQPDGEALQAVDYAGRTPAEFLRRGRERHAREAVEQGAERDLGLHASQGSAQAVVDAVPEGDVAADVTVEVETVRTGEPGGVAVSGRQRDDHPLAGR